MPRETIVLLGVAFIVIGVFTVILGSLLSNGENTNVEVGVGGFIGPIPFGFATNRKLFYVVVSLSAVVAVVWWLTQ